jgi:hypothetical protein
MVRPKTVAYTMISYGAATMTVTTQFSPRSFVSDGTNWFAVTASGA